MSDPKSGLDNSQLKKACDEFKLALKEDIGDIVAKHEEMILQYYRDVQKQAKQSFDSAEKVARIGFNVLIATLVYTLVFDALAHLPWKIFSSNPRNTLTVGGIGVISGLLIEFIAGVNFWLYSRAAKQFSAFHICLERTHRYLIAYKISEKVNNVDNKDEALQKLICIMANAPMITSRDTNDVKEGYQVVKGTHIEAVSSEMKTT